VREPSGGLSATCINAFLSLPAVKTFTADDRRNWLLSSARCRETCFWSREKQRITFKCGALMCASVH
jgi:hypothetical protein